MSRLTIQVEKPGRIDGGALDQMFGRSLAISSAVSKFWQLGLAKKAELGHVEETKLGYNVEILYREKRQPSLKKY